MMADQGWAPGHGVGDDGRSSRVERQGEEVLHHNEVC
jgi:hypothetical protein